MANGSWMQRVYNSLFLHSRELYVSKEHLSGLLREQEIWTLCGFICCSTLSCISNVLWYSMFKKACLMKDVWFEWFSVSSFKVHKLVCVCVDLAWWYFFLFQGCNFWVIPWWAHWYLNLISHHIWWESLLQLFYLPAYGFLLGLLNVLICTVG